MFQFDLLSLIPQSLKQTVRDVLVDFVADQAKKYASDELATKIKKLRSDAAFNKTFEEGLQQAARRFVEEYKVEDEDLVVAIAADKEFFKNEEIQKALLTVLKKPSAYLDDERDTLFQSFDTVLPQRLNRERVNRAIIYLLRCLTEELWHMPELQPVYSLQFQRVTAEATREQVAIQKAQLQALTGLNASIREALLQLTDAIAEKKALPAGDQLALPAPPKPKVYHNLPQPNYGHFVGRDKELVQVARILRPYPHSQEHLVTIDGIGGIGKSALALEVAHRYLHNYDRIPPEERFEAIIWTSAKQIVLTAEGITTRRQVFRTLDDIYTAIAVALQREDIIRARPEEQAEVVRQALIRQRTLLIVDNLETVDDEAVMTFLRELPAPTKAIVTTRHRLDVAYPVRLVGMLWEDAQQLIAQECQKKGITLSNDEVHRLYKRTGGVPLAVVWSIAQIGFGYGVDAVLTRLGQPTSDVARFCFEGAVEKIWGKPAHKLLLALSLFATAASREALGYIADLPELDRDEGLVELEKLSLTNKQDDRFDLLPLTKSFVFAQLKENSELEAIIGQAFIFYFSDLCKKYGGEQRHLYHYLDADFKNIQWAMAWAYQLKKWHQVGDFSNHMVFFLDKRGLWNELIKFAEMGVEAGIEVNDKRLVMKHKTFGLGFVKSSRFREHHEGIVSILEGRNLALELGDEKEYAITLFNEAVIHRRLDDWKKSKELFRRAIDIFQKLNDHQWEIRTLNAVGMNELISGNPDGALECYQQALKKANEIGDTELIASGLFNLGVIEGYNENFDKSRSHTNDALQLFEQLNILHWTGRCHFMIAVSNYMIGEINEARREANLARETFVNLGMQLGLQRANELIENMDQSPSSPISYYKKLKGSSFKDFSLA